jgi:hypothetical protein
MMQTAYPAVLRGSAMQQGAQKAFKQSMIKKLEKKPWIADHCLSVPSIIAYNFSDDAFMTKWCPIFR